MDDLKSENLPVRPESKLSDEGGSGVAIDKLHRQIQNHKSTIAIIGLGYVGLPLAIRFSEEGFKVAV